MIAGIFDFVAHYGHTIAFEYILMCLMRRSWQAFGATEERARAGLQLAPDDPERVKLALELHSVQRSAIWRIRFLACFMVGMLVLVD